MGAFAKESVATHSLLLSFSMFIPRSRGQARRRDSLSSDDEPAAIHQQRQAIPVDATPELLVTDLVYDTEIECDIMSSKSSGVQEIIAIDPSDLSDSSVASASSRCLSASQQALLEFRKKAEAEQRRFEGLPLLKEQLETNLKAEQLKLDAFRDALDAVNSQDIVAVTAALAAIQNTYPNEYKNYNLKDAAHHTRKLLNDNLRLS